MNFSLSIISRSHTPPGTEKTLRRFFLLRVKDRLCEVDPPSGSNGSGEGRGLVRRKILP